MTQNIDLDSAAIHWKHGVKLVRIDNCKLLHVLLLSLNQKKGRVNFFLESGASLLGDWIDELGLHCD